MIALLGVFCFFWTHSALWFYREYKDRRERRSGPHVRTDELPRCRASTTGVLGRWRLVHLVFALSVMMLVADRHGGCSTPKPAGRRSS